MIVISRIAVISYLTSSHGDRGVGVVQLPILIFMSDDVDMALRSVDVQKLIYIRLK